MKTLKTIFGDRYLRNGACPLDYAKKNFRFHELSEKISNFAADMQITHKNIGTMKRKLMISVMLLVANGRSPPSRTRR